MRKVKFITDGSGAGQMRAVQVAQEMQKQGMPADFGTEVGDFQQGIVVFVKRATGDQLYRAKSLANRAVFDAVDLLCYKLTLDAVEMLTHSDALLTCSIASKNELQHLFPNKRVFSIRHHWDPEVPKWASEFDKGWFPFPGYIGAEFNDPLKGSPGIVPIYNPAHWVRLAGLFHVHISVRPPGDPQARFKPGTKMATAAATGKSTIVMTRDAGNVELMPDNYPYWCDYNKESIEDTVRRAIDWDPAERTLALNLLREVKDKTSLVAVAKQYEQMFREVS